MQATSDFLGTEPVGRLTLRLAIPTVTAQLVNMLYNLVDRMYIGHIADIGSLALTGVGVCAPLILLISAFAALVFMGGAPRVSMLMGKGENEQAEKVMGNCFTLLVGLSILLTVVISIWDRDLLLLFGASENTVGYAEEYMRIYTLGTLFVQLTLGMNAFITAQGFAKVSMLTVLIGALCNIVLDPLFIFAFDLGVQGAAIATVLSQAVSAVWVMLFITGKKCVLRLKLRNLRVQPRLVAPCILLGLSPFVMQSTESVLSVCFNASLLKYGGDIAVGAMTILASVMQFAMLPLQGLTQGSQPIVSYNFGAGNVQRVRKAFRLLLIACVSYSTLLWLVCMLFPQWLAGAFSSDAALIAYTIPALRIYMACSLLFGLQIACQQTFIAIGNAKTSLFLAVLRKLLLLIPLIYILPALLEDKTTAVYLAEPVADTLAVITTVTMFSFQFRRALKQMEAAK
ncbi:MAG: MATE family efflux transporter [Candidatus Woodwardiibium sp.]